MGLREVALLASWEAGLERVAKRRTGAMVHSQYDDCAIAHVVDHAIAVYKDFANIRPSNLRDDATC
jgi:hypothetical protein